MDAKNQELISVIEGLFEDVTSHDITDDFAECTHPAGLGLEQSAKYGYGYDSENFDELTLIFGQGVFFSVNGAFNDKIAFIFVGDSEEENTPHYFIDMVNGDVLKVETDGSRHDGLPEECIRLCGFIDTFDADDLGQNQ